MDTAWSVKLLGDVPAIGEDGVPMLSHAGAPAVVIVYGVPPVAVDVTETICGEPGV